MLIMLRKNFINCTSGALTILWALMIPMIIGAVGIGVEISLWYAKKDSMQSTTEAAAVAAAYAIGTGGNLTNTAVSEMTRNGYNSNSYTITVNNPPTSGSYTANNNAVEVIVVQTQLGLFSKVLGISGSNIKTRSVVLFTPATTSGGCVMALNTLAIDTIDINGNVTINMPNCTMIDNSNANSAVYIGGSSTVTVNNIYTAGGITVNGSATLNNSIANVTNGSQLTDPFSSITTPAVGSCDQTNFTAHSGNTTMNPGVYCGGVSFNAQSNVTMNSGTYIINGGQFNINGQSIVNGSNITVILTNNATITVNGGATLNLSAPTTGSYAGMLFYGDRANNNSNNDFLGGATMNLTGIIYMPSSTVNFNGGATAGGSCSRIVAFEVNFHGTSNINNSCPAGYPGIPVPSGNGSVKIKE